MSHIPDMHSIDDCAGDVAAYVLGALDPEEVDTFRRHLETCVVCREEVHTLRQVADALPMAAPQHPVPRSLRRRVLAEVRAEARARTRAGRGRPTWLVGLRGAALAGSAALAVAVAAIVGVEVTSSSGTSTHVYAASIGDAQLRTGGGHAELIVHRLAQPAAGHVYEVWLKRGEHAPSPTKALFSVTSSGEGDVDVPGNLHGVTTVMVTQEPAGGTQAPTTAPVIVASLT